jgi:cytoskeletal protein RodZ
MFHDDTHASDDNERRNELKKLGSQLMAIREAQGLSYKDVSNATHVRPHVIQSIEDGTIEESSAPVYARGFLKTYCEFLMASDLWKKYNHEIPSEENVEVPPDSMEAPPIKVKPPTPVFRRSSIIWVYFVLIIAVLGAAYLLWGQMRDPGRAAVFPPGAASSLDSGPAPPEPKPESKPEPKTKTDASGYVPAAPVPAAVQRAFRPEPANGGQAVPSRDVLTIPPPRNSAAASSMDSAAIVPGDISWMDGTSGEAGSQNAWRREASPPAATPPPIVTDNRLTVEITGGRTQLTVERGGRIVTRRTLREGGRRVYRVTSDTKLTLSSGNRASVTWLGRKYDSAGADAMPLCLVFRPDGTVALLQGNSQHFGKNITGGNR